MAIKTLKTDRYLYQDFEYEVLYKVNTRAKRVGIRVNDKRQIVVTFPRVLLLKSAENFFKKNNEWINSVLSKFSGAIISDNELKDGMFINLVGNPYLILRFDGRVKTFLINKSEKQLLVNPSNLKKHLKLFYKSMAEQIFKSRVEFYAQKVGVQYRRISIKDQSTRWGSCSSSKVLSFSWRVVLAPKEVIDYLILHEVSHLKYMDHSKNFWGTVESVMQDYKKYDKWLRVNGYKLKGFLN